MQSGTGGEQSQAAAVCPNANGGRGRILLSSASPPSSSAVPMPNLGFDGIQQQHQLGHRVPIQQLLNKSEGNEALLAAYQAGNFPGMRLASNYNSSSASIPTGQQSKQLVSFGPQHGSFQIKEEVQNKSDGVGRQAMNPVHQAYLQFALQSSQQKAVMGMHLQPQKNMQDFISAQVKGRGQMIPSKPDEQSILSEKQVDHKMQPPLGQKSDPRSSGQQPIVGHIAPVNVVRSIQNSPNQQQVSPQLQAMQAWALERNIDLSSPSNAHLIAQLMPLMQSRCDSRIQVGENSSVLQSSLCRQQVTSHTLPSEYSPQANSSSDMSGQSGSGKARPSTSIGFTNTGSHILQQNSDIQPPNSFPVVGSGSHSLQPHPDNNHGSKKTSTVSGSVMAPVYHRQQSTNPSPSIDQLKTGLPGPLAVQGQYFHQLSQPSQTTTPCSERSLGNQTSGQSCKERSVVNQTSPQQSFGFTKQQMHVLKAQILAFRRLKKGDGSLPQELLQGIVPPPLEMQQLPQVYFSAGVSDRVAENTFKDHKRHFDTSQEDKKVLLSSSGCDQPTEKSLVGDVIVTPSVHKRSFITSESIPENSGIKIEKQNAEFEVKPEKGMENGIPKVSAISEPSTDRGKSFSVQGSECEENQVKNSTKSFNAAQSRKYHGPLFDFPFFTRKHDNFGSGVTMNNNNNLSLAYDLKDLLYEEGLEVLQKKRTENINKIGGLLAVNLERKRIKPDLVLRLQIEEKKLRLLELQARVRDEVDQQQQEIMAMPDRPYRKFVRQCERQRMELARQVQASQKAIKEKQIKSIFQWRKKLLEAHWASRDARTARNRGVAKYHEKMLREFSKRKDDDRDKRMEALKNNDVERYREMLMEQQTSISGAAAERYAVLSSFLTQTEDYLHKLGSKITATKSQQEVEEASSVAAAAARAQGLSEEEIKAAAACAGQEVMIRNRFSEMNEPKDSSVNKYYHLAHAVNERVVRQPSMLRAGTLRDYQLVGLQWMLSLYNNKLNGILADEMGLGKTVQVMALIAYLMEFKGNYGPHLIIVPNAVLVNWKSEFHSWLPSVSCIFYVGSKDHRSRVFTQEVSAIKFNVLVTTYEFIMYDRSKLSKVDWRYIIIDEAQRMKDRESVLARDLDRYKCQRRLLLTGTPLQNDLKELWSLLNLLLPEVFDNRKAFHDWFSQPFQKEGSAHNAEDDWLETEKKVIIIHRLHQILEPFMLRRRVEDVEGTLPPKVSIVLRCRMSAFQSAIYDWIRSTGTLRIDPEDEKRRVQKNFLSPPKTYKILNNRCMELRKVCNHPLLTYPYFQDFSKDFLVRSCGKLWILDRILMKLQRTGHRVLLFSTMTKLLDILEEYLQWRRLVYRRIDGTTSLEDRESAIMHFNSPGTDCFIFLLSIRAAGRGLNLQSADTVVIYDPDPNPKNEEQAVARAHRIGQTREVKVIYMEAVVDKISSHQKEDEFRSGGVADMEDDLAGKDRYMGSIESLIRKNIQQYKIDMADEVINAGRFDQRTTHEERRLTLETLLHDEERYQETVHDVPSLLEVNRMIARSEDEVELFDQMDEELDWAEEMMRYDQVPKWLRPSSREVNAAISKMSKKPSKSIVYATSAGIESDEALADESSIAERKGGRSRVKKLLNYAELEDDNGEFSEESSEDNGFHEDDGEIEDEDMSGVVEVAPANKVEFGEGTPVCNIGYDFSQASESIRNYRIPGAGSSGSSDDIQRMTLMASPNSSRKFGSLSALDARPGSVSRRTTDELEEGEIAVSGDSRMGRQHLESWVRDRDEGEDEQVLQPKIKRKRSIRLRPCQNFDWKETKCGMANVPLQHEQSHHLLYEPQLRKDTRSGIPSEFHSLKTDQSELLLKGRRILPTRRSASRLDVSPGSTRLNCIPVPEEDTSDAPEEICDGKIMRFNGPINITPKMSETVQRKCKNVIGKLQKRIDAEGHQIVPLLTDLWKRSENSGFMGGSGPCMLDVRKISNRIDRLEYSRVVDFVLDVQLMLKAAMQVFGFSHEVRTEAKKVHDLFFDIMKTAFPDSEFCEMRNNLSFSVSLSTSPLTSPRQHVVSGQSRRHKFINEVDDVASVPKPAEESRLRSQRESRGGNLEESLLAHPGDFVIRKKRRKEREKPTMKLRSGLPDLGSALPVPRGIRNPGQCLLPKDARAVQQGLENQRLQYLGFGGGWVGWANTVKKTRTDSARRRQSHL